MQRAVAGALLVGALAALSLGASNVAGHHYGQCPPAAGFQDVDVLDASADCAVYNTGYDDLPDANERAPENGCDGPVMAYATYERVEVTGNVGVDGDKYYVCASKSPGENGLWKETNSVSGLQTEAAADTYCSTEPAECAPTVTKSALS